MLSILVVVLFVAVVIALGLAFGGALLIAALVLAALALAVWAVRIFSPRPETATESGREERVETPELLGPGGPDDPRASSSG